MIARTLMWLPAISQRAYYTMGLKASRTLWAVWLLRAPALPMRP
jgi:hypothetical protein